MHGRVPEVASIVAGAALAVLWIGSLSTTCCAPRPIRVHTLCDAGRCSTAFVEYLRLGPGCSAHRATFDLPAAARVRLDLVATHLSRVDGRGHFTFTLPAHSPYAQGLQPYQVEYAECAAGVVTEGRSARRLACPTSRRTLELRQETDLHDAASLQRHRQRIDAEGQRTRRIETMISWLPALPALGVAAVLLRALRQYACGRLVRPDARTRRGRLRRLRDVLLAFALAIMPATAITAMICLIFAGSILR